MTAEFVIVIAAIVIALVSLAISLVALVVALRRPINDAVNDALAFGRIATAVNRVAAALEASSTLNTDAALYRVARAIDLHAERLPNVQKMRAQRRAMSLSRALNQSLEVTPDE